MRILTIHPYRPSLNLVKELILSIKSKIKIQHFQGKVILLAFIKSVVDEVVLLEIMVDTLFKHKV